jgi:hypothetical protein
MKKIIITGFFVLSAMLCSAQKEAQLAKEIVTISNGKMNFDEFYIASHKGESSQIKIHAEITDNGFMSRDNFVYWTGVSVQDVLEGILDENAVTEMVDEITGSADITLNMYYSKTGVQMELDIAGEKTKTMLKWSELL